MNSSRIFSVIACLMGAGGVIAAAAAAHGGGDNRLGAAAQMLLVHAAVGLALSRRDDGSRVRAIAVAAIEAGAILFAADMGVRVLAGQALFPYAAPAGGMMLIAGWIMAASSFAFISRKSGQ